MKITTKIVSVTILIWLIALLTPILNVSAVKPYLPPFLYGNRVNLLELSFPPVTEIDLPVDEPFYIVHGIAEPWKELSVEDRRMFMDDSLTRFELSIDGVPQGLRKWMNQYIDEFGSQWKRKAFYIQFDPYEFDVGSSPVFEGSWYAYGSLIWSHTVTINFIAGS